MKKLLSLLAVGAVGVMMSGCGITDPASSVTISITSIGAVVVGGAAGQVEGTIEADSIITNVTMKILTDADVDATAKFTVAFTSGYSGKEKADLKTDMSTTIAAKATATAGSYKLEITAQAGSITSSSTKVFTVTGGSTGTPVTPTTFTLGSLGNATLGSSIELDNGTVMLAAAAKADGSGVDLVGTYSSDLTAMRIFSPAYAKNESGITAFASWVNPAATSFVKVPRTTTFASITTKEQIEPLYTAGTAITSSNAAEGDVFIVKTNLNNYIAVEVTAFDSNTTGTFTIKSAK